MILDDFLVLLGVEADVKQVKEFNAALAKVTTIATAAVGILSAIAGATVMYFDGAIRGAKDLAKEKGLLFDISKKELAQAEEYAKAMDKTGKSIQSIKTKIALGLVPTLLGAINKFNQFISAHKELIASGIEKVIHSLYKIIQVFINFGRFIDKVITGTIGWKNAMYLLAAAVIYLNRKALMGLMTNPVFLVIAAIAALLLLIDDFMTYMDGGQSAFGDYWAVLLDWIEENKEALTEIVDVVKMVFEVIGNIISKSIGNIIYMFGNLLGFVWNILKAMVGLFTGNTDMIREAWSGMVKFAIGFFINLWEVIKNIINEIVGAFTGSAFDIESVLDDIFVSVAGTFNKASQVLKKWLDVAKSIFSAVFYVVTMPFQNAFDLVTGLYDIFTDDTTSWTEKLGAVLELIFDIFIGPFRQAFEWVLAQFGVTQGDIKRGVKAFTSIFSSVYNAIVSPFKRAFDWVMSAWNNTIGRLSSGINSLKNLWGGLDLTAANASMAKAGVAGGNVYNTNTYGGAVSNNVTVNGANQASVKGTLDRFGVAGRNTKGAVKY